MALTKSITVDKIEIVGPFRHVQVRTATIVEEDGIELSRSFSRHVVSPGADTSNLDPQVQAVCASVHTQEVIDAFNAHIAQSLEDDEGA